MSENGNLRFSESGMGLFSAQQIEGLMRVEFDRAQRHKYPLVCLMIALDRLGTLQDLYGYDSKEDILAAVIAMLHQQLRDSDSLGRMADDRLLVVFPHTTQEVAAALARRILTSARKLRFERDGRSLRVSLSVGVASNRHEGVEEFETLLRVAEEGLAVADAAGGDRFVETELYHLVERQRRRRPRGNGPADGDEAGELEAVPTRRAARPTPPPPLPPSRDELVGRALLEFLSAQGFDEASLAELDQAAIFETIRKLQAQQAAAAADLEPADGLDPAEKDRQIDMLERRLAKMAQILGSTEEELRRIAAMKGIETGLSSIYREVQGLAGGEAQFERKREMMKTIFQANFELKKLLDPE